MSELADRIRARNAGSGMDDWFRRQQEENAAAMEAEDDVASSSSFSSAEDRAVAPRVYVVPSAVDEIRGSDPTDQLEPTGPGGRPGAAGRSGTAGLTEPAAQLGREVASPAGRHALARKRPFWLTRPCPSWCQADHSERDRPAERRHVSAPQGSVVLTESEAAPAGDGSWLPQDIHVALTQHVREVEPLISCGGHGPAGAWQLTVDEARELAAALTRAVQATDYH